ncbi:MAG: S8 family serine peptidase [Caulobacterales bacterium]|nr:S8 family serine peptidase [Caulobacterales bacterium]
MFARLPTLLAALALLALAGPVLAQAPATSRPAADLPAMASAGVAERQVLVLLRLPPEHFRADGGYAGGYGGGVGRAARQRIAERLAREHGLALAEGWPMPLVGLDCFVMTAPPGRAPAQVAAELARDREVAWSEPMHVYRAEGAAAGPPNDPLYRLQPAAREWRLADLHQIATGKDVRVAVVDSGVDTAHPDLAGRIQLSQDFVPDHPGRAELHGTGVAGVIAAVEGNHLGIVGVAPEARLMALRACWQPGEGSSTICDTLSLAKALHFAVEHDAQVINLSLAGPPDLLLGRLIDAAQARGAVVVSAADPRLARGGFPASHPGVVAVTDDPARGGEIPAYVAPGRDVPTTQPGGRWSLVAGSSFAAAHVSGLYALMRQRDPHERGPPALVPAHTGGPIDACATLLRVSAPCRACACAQPASYAAARP